MGYERLQKLIARAGVAARRKAEEIILAGRVTVNGNVIKELGAKADPERDRITVDGRRIEMPRTATYIVFWKPSGVVTGVADEHNRRTIGDFVQAPTRVFPVGQLDADTDGLLLLTDDGRLAASLTRPGAMLEKVYRCRVKGFVGGETMDKLRAGVQLEEGLVKPDGVRIYTADEGPRRGPPWLELTMSEAPNHLIRRILQAAGHQPIQIRRVRYGPLDLEGLRPGKWRNLRHEELARLKAAANALKKKAKNAQDS